MDIAMIVFEVVVLLFSAILHEIAHGFVADKLGDPTARLSGRLTLNPIKHLDLVGSVLLPLAMILSGTGMVFGWAKPVVYNPYNLKNKRSGEFLIALAGPLSNISIAVIFSLIIRFVLSSAGMNIVVGIGSASLSPS